MKKLFIILIGLLWLNPGWSQSPLAGDVRMFLDYARFRYDESNTYLEIYYMLYPQNLQKMAGTQRFELSLLNEQSDTLIASSTVPITFDANVSPEDVIANTRSGLIKRVVPEGKYRIRLGWWNQNMTAKLDSVCHSITAAHFTPDKIGISDIELCSRIITRSQNTESHFYKNTMEVLPNPTRMFGKGSPVLFYYVELYNVTSTNAQDELAIEVVIADTDGNIRLKKNYKRGRASESLVELGQFNVSKLEDGMYILIFAASDPLNNVAVYNRSNFYVTNPDVIVADESSEQLTYLKETFENMSELDLDEKFAPIRYITNDRERKIYTSMNTVESKRTFLFNFWKDREKKESGSTDRFYGRVEEANKRFKYSNIPGWESDRGRVYIVYGEPDRINRKPYNPDSWPYEIWNYIDLQGGGRFLFMDETGFGDYKLKTSNVRGEIQDPTYDEQLKEID